jgi:hypothetical protein
VVQGVELVGMLQTALSSPSAAVVALSLHALQGLATVK